MSACQTRRKYSKIYIVMGGWRNGRRARLRTVWTKVLKGSTPFPPIFSYGFFMKKYDYPRYPSASLGRKRKIRQKHSVSSLKPILFFFVFIFLCVLSYVGVSKAYEAFAASRLAKWIPTSVTISGAKDPILGEVRAEAEKKINTVFTVKDAVKLQNRLIEKYSQLGKVTVKRGLLSGKIKISVAYRKPIAKFLLSDRKTMRYIDQDGIVYADPDPEPKGEVPFVELEGVVPDKLGEEFVSLLETSLKLKNQLNYSFLRYNPLADIVKMHMPDGCVIDFGRAQKMRQKAKRAAQIEEIAKEGFPHPHELDFTYFDEGKVFLRQKAH